MITEIRVSNFYSIGEKQTISFIKKGVKPENGYVEIKPKENLSLINGFFGTNASGKTNALRAIVTLVALMYNVPVPNQIYGPNQSQYGIIPNFDSKFENNPITLGADFLFEDNLYLYDIEFSKNGEIIKEELQIKQNQSKVRAQPKLIYTRTLGNKIKTGLSYEKIGDYLKNIILPDNQSLFALCLLQGFEFTLDFREKIFMWNVDNSTILPGIAMAMNTCINITHNKKWLENNSLEVITEALKLFDKSIEGIEINTKDQGISIKIKHTGFKEMVDFQNESRGTQELFTYIYQIIEVLRNGGVVIYDEINRFFHPDIQNAIFNLFLKTSKNTKNAQLFFSSHSYEIMNELELNQIHLVEKENTSSIITKLSDYADAKSRDNVAKKYRLGVYGAVPDMVEFNYTLNELI